MTIEVNIWEIFDGTLPPRALGTGEFLACPRVSEQFYTFDTKPVKSYTVVEVDNVPTLTKLNGKKVSFPAEPYVTIFVEQAKRLKVSQNAARAIARASACGSKNKTVEKAARSALAKSVLVTKLLQK